MRKRFAPAGLTCICPILVSFCLAVPLACKAGDAPTLGELTEILEQHETMMATVSFKCSRQQWHDAEKKASLTSATIDVIKGEKDPDVQEYVRALREELASLEDPAPEPRRKTVQCVIQKQASGGICYSISRLVVQPDTATTVVSVTETYNGEKCTYYSPQGKSAVVDTKPISIWSDFNSPYTLPLFYDGVPLSQYIRSHNPQVMSRHDDAVVVRCGGPEGQYSFGGKSVIAEKYVQFRFSSESQWLPTVVEQCLRDVVSTSPTKVIERVPVRWSIAYKDWGGGQLFPSRTMQEGFKWVPENAIKVIPANGEGVDKGRMFHQGYYTVFEVSEFRINEEIPAGTFDAQLPSGTSVYDRVLKSNYRVP